MSRTSLAARTFALACLFTFPAAAHVGMVSPVGGESLPCGTSFNVKWTVVIPHDQTSYDLEYSTNGSNGPWTPIATGLPPGDLAKGSIHSFDWSIPDDVSNSVRVRVVMHNATNLWDDISPSDLSIVNMVASDLGGGKIGGNGQEPRLNACGDLSSGATATLTLLDAPASTTLLLFAGPQSNPTSFFGGTLMPSPIAIVLPTVTDANGSLTEIIPGGLGPASVVLQGVMVDNGATQGVGISNAIQLTWP